jgi:hypothetical protein
MKLMKNERNNGWTLFILEKRRFTLAYFFNFGEEKYQLRFQGMTKDNCSMAVSKNPIKVLMATMRSCSCSEASNSSL